MAYYNHFCLDSVVEDGSGCNRHSYLPGCLHHEDRSDPHVDRRAGRPIGGLVSGTPDAVMVHLAWGAAAGSLDSGSRPDP